MTHHQLGIHGSNRFVVSNHSKKQADALNVIVEKEGLKYGIIDKNELVRFIVGEFLARYEEKHGLIKVIKSGRFSEARSKENSD